MYEESKSAAKIVQRSNEDSEKTSSGPIVMIAAGLCVGSIYFHCQCSLFISIFLILSTFVTSQKGGFQYQTVSPLLGITPSFFKMGYEVIECLITGEPL